MTITQPVKRRTDADRAATARVLSQVRAERIAQDAKWGEQNHPDVDPILLGRAGGCTPQRMAEHYEIPTAQRARQACQSAPVGGGVTWAHILVEEVAEAVQAATLGDEVALRIELVQIAAVAVAHVEAIDRRSTAEADMSEAEFDKAYAAGTPVEVVGVLSPAEKIRSWLPDHTHTAPWWNRGGATWTWTTPDGTWQIALWEQILTHPILSFDGPAGCLLFDRLDETALRRLHGVLVALDAIEAPVESAEVPS